MIMNGYEGASLTDKLYGYMKDHAAVSIWHNLELHLNNGHE